MKFIKKNYLIPAILLLAAGCTNNDKVLYVDVKNEAIAQSNKYVSSFGCFAGIMGDHSLSDPSAMAVIVESFKDGSVPSVVLNGPLMDHADILFQFYLNIGLARTQAVLYDSAPLIYATGNTGKVGVNRFNIVDPEEHNSFLTRVKSKLEKYRLVYQKKLQEQGSNITSKDIDKKYITVYKIAAAFTRNDSSQFYGDTHSLDTQYSKEENRGNIAATLSENQKTMGLTIKIIDAFDNSIAATQSFNIIYDTTRGRYRVGLGLDDFKLSSTFSITKIESPDSAQDALVRTAALWTLFVITQNKYNQEYYEKCEAPKEEKAS